MGFIVCTQPDGHKLIINKSTIESVKLWGDEESEGSTVQTKTSFFVVKEDIQFFEDIL